MALSLHNCFHVALLFNLLFVARFVFSEPTNLSLALHQSKTFSFHAIQKVSVGNGRIIRVRSVNSNEIIVTGLRKGQTSLHVWVPEKKIEYWVTVVPPSYEPTLAARHKSDVIKITLEFIEVNSTKLERLGIRWPDYVQLQHSPLTSTTELGGLAVSSPGTVLDLLIREGEAKVLARPELFVRQGEEASFHAGQDIPIQTFSEAFGRVNRKVEWKPVGIHLKIRPDSLDGKNIFSEIKFELSELNNSLQIENIPSIIKRRIDTKMNSLDGEKVVLSGLTRELVSSHEQKTPFFSKMPLVGIFFKSNSDQNHKTELLVSLTLKFSALASKQVFLRPKYYEFPERP